MIVHDLCAGVQLNSDFPTFEIRFKEQSHFRGSPIRKEEHFPPNPRKPEVAMTTRMTICFLVMRFI